MAHNYVNTASRAVLDAPLNSSTGTFTVTGFTGYPAVPFFVLLDRDSSSAELVEITNVAGSSLTGNRGVGGTAGTSHSAGGTVEHVIPAAVPQAVEQHIEATTNVHGVTGALIGADSEGTLANKTFVGAHVHNYTDTLPAAPNGGFVVNADSSLGRDGFVASNAGANTDRSGFVLRQSGSDRFNAFYDGTVKVTPSGVSGRPGIESTTSIKAEDLIATDDITAGGDITATGNVTGANGNFGNVNVSGNMTSTNDNTVGTLNALGKITAASAGTGLTVNNLAEVGSLAVTSGNAVLSGSNARLQFPASPTASNPGTAVGQTRYRSRRLEVWDGTNWYDGGNVFGSTVQSGHTTGTVSATNTTIYTHTITGSTAGAAYYMMCQGQVEINSVTDGTRFDLVARLDNATSGDVIAVGLGNNFTQTGLGFSARLTGNHTIYWVVTRTVGGGSGTVTAFNAMFTNVSIATTSVD